MTNPAKTVKFLLLWLISFTAMTTSASSFDDTILKLNPEFKLKRMSNGTVIMTSVQTGDVIKHEFSDLYADILLAAYRKQRLGYIQESIEKKYYYSEEDCRREIKHALNVLSEWNIIIREDRLASLK
jgi:hypothetical protein